LWLWRRSRASCDCGGGGQRDGLQRQLSGRGAGLGRGGVRVAASELGQHIGRGGWALQQRAGFGRMGLISNGQMPMVAPWHAMSKWRCGGAHRVLYNMGSLGA